MKQDRLTIGLRKAGAEQSLGALELRFGKIERHELILRRENPDVATRNCAEQQFARRSLSTARDMRQFAARKLGDEAGPGYRYGGEDSTRLVAGVLSLYSQSFAMRHSGQFGLRALHT